MKKAIMPLLLALVILLIVPALGSCACTHDDIRCYVNTGPPRTRAALWPGNARNAGKKFSAPG